MLEFEISLFQKKPTDQTENTSEDFGLCPACGGPKIDERRCSRCPLNLLIDELGSMSDDKEVNDFIIGTITTALRPFGYGEFIPHGNFKNIEEIGKGNFTTVYSATRTNCLIGPYEWNEKDKKYVRNNAPNFSVALKSFHNKPDIAETFLNEIKTHHKCMRLQKKSKFLQCYGISRNPETKEFIIVLNYADHGDLHSFLNINHKTLKWIDRLQLITEIAEDLVNIHNDGLILGNFYNGNKLQFPERTRVSDFGLSRSDEVYIPGEGLYRIVPYVAPEVLSGNSYRQPADVYTFGIIMWEVSSGRPAFSDLPNNNKLISQICNLPRPQNVNGTPECYTELMKKCWDEDPMKRPKAEELYKTCLEWYNCVNEQKVELGIYQEFAKAD